MSGWQGEGGHSFGRRLFAAVQASGSTFQSVQKKQRMGTTPEQDVVLLKAFKTWLNTTPEQDATFLTALKAWMAQYAGEELPHP